MSTIRIAHRRGYVVVGNDIARHPDLSFMAIGLLTYMLSLPDNATIRSEDLAKDESKEGRDAVRRCLQAIEAAGYLVRERRQDERGRWQTISTLFDHPVTSSERNPQAKTPGRTEDGIPGVGDTGSETPGQTEDGIPGVGQPNVGEPNVGKPGAKNQVPLPSTKTPLPPATRHSEASKRQGQGAAPPVTPRLRRDRGQATGSRAEGTNPRAIAQREAEQAHVAEQLAVARGYGERMASVDHADPPDAFEAQLQAELARGMSTWTPETLSAAVAAYTDTWRPTQPDPTDPTSPTRPVTAPSKPGRGKVSYADRIRAEHPQLFAAGIDRP